MPDKNEKYQRKLQYCLEKIKEGKRVALWKQAAEVYEHLLKCPLSHTMKNDGRIKCRELGT